MKKLFITLCVLLFTAGAAYAGPGVEMWGQFEVEGIYYDNYFLAPNNTVTWSDYDMELELWLKLIASETTYVTTRFNMLDNVWANQKNGIEADIDLDRSANDDNIAVQRAFLTHLFSNGTKLDVGLMEGDRWGTAFGESEVGRYRIQATHDTPAGTVQAYIQKDVEWGNQGNDDDEDDDADSYGIGLETTIGCMNVMPQIVYSNNSNYVLDQDNDGRKTYQFIVAVTGGKDMLEFEAELAFQNVDYSGIARDDANLYGVYGNLWANLDANKIGLLFAYGNYDNDAMEGFDFGDDLDVTLLLDEAVPVLLNNQDLSGFGDMYAGLTGVVLVQIYGDIAISDKLNVLPSLTYLADNMDGVDATAFEVNLSADYKITDMLTYSAGIAYSKIDAEIGAIDLDDIDSLMVLHRLVLDF